MIVCSSCGSKSREPESDLPLGCFRCGKCHGLLVRIEDPPLPDWFPFALIGAILGSLIAGPPGAILGAFLFGGMAVVLAPAKKSDKPS